jgi:hypothetical protein
MSSKPICLAILAVGLPAASQALVIDFEGGTAPLLFANAEPLADRYGSINVLFRGPTADGGGAILHQDSGFGVTAASGVNFLAFNETAEMKNGGIPEGSERVLFGMDPGTVSIWVADGDVEGESVFFLKAYDAVGDLVASDSIVTGGWAQMSVTAGGISYVEFDMEGGDGMWVADDLQIAAVPEPATLAAISVGALALLKRKPRRRA